MTSRSALFKVENYQGFAIHDRFKPVTEDGLHETSGGNVAAVRE
jgi:hypothetical protein